LETTLFGCTEVITKNTFVRLIIKVDTGERREARGWVRNEETESGRKKETAGGGRKEQTERGRKENTKSKV
jgi:hypothetical protein